MYETFMVIRMSILQNNYKGFQNSSASQATLNIINSIKDYKYKYCSNLITIKIISKWKLQKEMHKSIT